MAGACRRATSSTFSSVQAVCASLVAAASNPAAARTVTRFLIHVSIRSLRVHQAQLQSFKRDGPPQWLRRPNVVPGPRASLAGDRLESRLTAGKRSGSWAVRANLIAQANPVVRGRRTAASAEDLALATIWIAAADTTALDRRLRAARSAETESR
jgi:hypothetical protein